MNARYPLESDPAQRPSDTPHYLSIVIPMYNEEDSVPPMAEQVHDALSGYPHPWELILVNDGSSDATERRMIEAVMQYGRHVRVVSLQRNFGQTAAMQAGIDSARGDVIATLDGDLQNDPHDIPRMAARLLDEDLDLVAGWRASRQDKLWSRRLPSLAANRLIGRITGVRLHDYGCTLKVFRTDVLKGIRLYGEMHRFIPAWLAANTAPSRIKEEVVAHHPRRYGGSKYGMSRALRVLLDLLSVYFFMRFRSRPGHFFGRIGLVFGALGALALGYLFIVKVFFGEDIGTRPLLLVGVLFVVMSIQFLTTGVLSELIARTYFESSAIKPYIIRSVKKDLEQHEPEWKRSQ
jgi:glycosyltransferase involved in cell wall biosynthesis